MAQIFSIGSGLQKQASMREDGTWFIRLHRQNKPGWGKWHLAIENKRPDHAWYNPQAGNSKLPKDINYAKSNRYDTTGE